jgi:DNA polymerase III delta prime subunit
MDSIIEKLRPSTLNDFTSGKVNPVTLISNKDGEIDLSSSMIFYGPPGVGKTSLARVLANELFSGSMEINGSDDNGVDTIRNRVMPFCRSNSITGGKKLVIIDEACRLTPQAQDALKVPIEECSSSCVFVFICNNIGAIIEPLRSRCRVINFGNIGNEYFVLSAYKICQKLGLSTSDIAGAVRGVGSDLRAFTIAVSSAKSETPPTSPLIDAKTSKQARDLAKKASPTEIESAMVDMFNHMVDGNAPFATLAKMQAYIEGHKKTSHQVINFVCAHSLFTFGE